MPRRHVDWCATFRKAFLLERGELVETRNQEDCGAELSRNDGAERGMYCCAFGNQGARVSSHSRHCPHQQISRHEHPRGTECFIRVPNGLRFIESEDHERSGRKHHRHHHDYPVRKEIRRMQARGHCNFSGVAVRKKECPRRERELHQQNQCENELKRWMS